MIRIRVRIRIRIRIRVRVRVKNTAGAGGCGLVWLGLEQRRLHQASPQCSGQRHTGVR